MYKHKLRNEILDVVYRNWPIHASGICNQLSLETSVANIAKISYHLKCLKKEGKLNLKKIDRALVAWPGEMEKLRIIHEMLKE